MFVWARSVKCSVSFKEVSPCDVTEPPCGRGPGFGGGVSAVLPLPRLCGGAAETEVGGDAAGCRHQVSAPSHWQRGSIGHARNHISWLLNTHVCRRGLQLPCYVEHHHIPRRHLWSHYSERERVLINSLIFNISNNDYSWLCHNYKLKYD